MQDKIAFKKTYVIKNNFKCVHYYNKNIKNITNHIKSDGH